MLRSENHAPKAFVLCGPRVCRPGAGLRFSLRGFKTLTVLRLRGPGRMLLLLLLPLLLMEEILHYFK